MSIRSDGADSASRAGSFAATGGSSGATGTTPTTSFVRRTLLDDVSEAILDLIRSQGLAAGDRLPSARDLAARFSVATPTLREALRRLEATGVLDIRHGSGVYVRDLSRLILANPHRHGLEHDTILDLLEARELIEPPLAEMAADRCTPSQLADLGEILTRAGAALTDDAELAASNMAFHRAIGQYAGNPILAQMLDSIVDIYAPEQQQILRLHGDRRSDHAEHLEILGAISAGEPARAGALMRTHLACVRQVVGVALRSPP
ncbi:FadR/GntR family transcriptional regulator [Actinopolymorpha sp. B11F2]|uniref:FadR/GntR family transcriptional regulator n=1 Tax=Actinopolymorpha sp. B11F2 TaxID=3160862 RepID=UPI0032E425B8